MLVISSSPRAWFNVGRDVGNLSIVEVQTRYCVVRLWNPGLFLDADDMSVLVELNHAEGSGVLYGVAEHYGSTVVFGFLLYPLELASETLSIEHIVTQIQRARLTDQKVVRAGKCFGKPARLGLFGVLKPHAQLGAVPPKAP